MTGVLIALALIASGLLARRWLLYRQGPPPTTEPFDGTIYRVGSALIAERRAAAPEATVICMHGFCENARYFTQHYSEPTIQLILLTSSDYHLALTGAEEHSTAWASEPDAPEGSIEYDAAVLVQALAHLPKTDRVRVHGHSRGGAVVLEAAAMRPELFRGVEVVLEAPVLPQGRLRQPITAPLLWLLPFLLPLWRLLPILPPGLARWGSLDDPRKRELIASLPFNGRRAATLLANIRSLLRWTQERGTDIYRHVDHGVVLVPSNDQVLSARSMRRSAGSAGSPLRVLDVEASHFVLLDRPAAMPPLQTRPADVLQGETT